MTTYTDDYKPRGENWSQNMKPRLFSTEEKAEVELLKDLKKHMYDTISERFDSSDTPPFNEAERWQKVDGGWQLLPEHANSLQDVEEEIGPLIEGEFVSVTLSWDISKVQIDA